MSDNFGVSVRFPAKKLKTEDDLKAMYPDHAHLANAAYNRLIKDYFACVTKYLNNFYEPTQLE